MIADSLQINLAPSERSDYREDEHIVIPPESFGNYMHLQTWGTDMVNQFAFTKGTLRPCKTRHEVDKVMDKYQKDLVKLLPQWQGPFKRDAKVIIDGDKVCSGEP